MVNTQIISDWVITLAKSLPHEPTICPSDMNPQKPDPTCTSTHICDPSFYSHPRILTNTTELPVHGKLEGGHQFVAA